MGNCTSPTAREAKVQKAISDEIDRQIEEDSKKFKRECKVLILGPDKDGMSMLVKQMKIVHQNGYTPDELAGFKYDIYSNIIDSSRDIVKGMLKTGLNPLDPANKVGEL